MAGSRRNLELKAIDRDPGATLTAALALDGARDEGVRHQRDTYFHVDRVPPTRLKLREAPPAMAELISYARADREGPKVSHYRLVPISDPGALTAALDDALGVRVVVQKARRLILWRNVRIHLDRVARLGDFVELEAIATALGGLDVERERVEHLRAALGIADADLVARGYADLLEAQARAPEGPQLSGPKNGPSSTLPRPSGPSSPR